MRSRRSANQQVAEVARRRLELLSAELAAIRPDSEDPPSRGPGGSGEPLGRWSSTDPAEPSTPAARPGRHARRGVGRGSAAAGWLQDRLPATLQGRVSLGPSHLAVVAVVVALAMAGTAWWAVRANDPGELVPLRTTTHTGGAGVAGPSAVTDPQPGASGVAPAPPAASGPAGTVVVDVAGKVRRPGIVELEAGARVVDAVEAAGGARRGADLRDLNLARVLVDGEQVLVGVPGVAGVAPSAAAAPGQPSVATPMVNLNTADQAALETLPGVGPVTAQAILQWRTEHGSFRAVDELLDVSGIGEATLAEIAPFVTL
jgi:competence protein ComEA